MPKDLLVESRKQAEPERSALDDAWAELRRAKDKRSGRIADLFASDPRRAERYSVEAAGVFIDFSKQDVDDGALRALIDLTHAARLADWRKAMFSGEPVNSTEGRPALHAMLRASRGRDLEPSLEPMTDRVRAERERAERFAAAVLDGRARGVGGRFQNIINIGIGGSDLGPALVATALDRGARSVNVHFVSNVDGAALGPLLHQLDPARTLVIVCSKTFSTLETRTNADTAKLWLTEALGEEEARRHFAAATVNAEAAERFGVQSDRIFRFWDWVGGRISLWSSVGLAAMIAIGPTAFREFLCGAEAMDAHFADAPAEKNAPVLLGALDVWHRAVRGRASRAVAVYDERLRLLPDYLQQLEMESNGKGVDRDGEPVREGSAAVVWGGVGCDAQHAFFQMLHQGPDTIPVDFLIAKHGASRELEEHHRLLMSNCFAQSRALMTGLSETEAFERLVGEGKSEIEARELAAHMVCPGDRPSTTILFDQLDPYTLGALLALAEHRVFVAGLLYGVNPFDQFGVELGKRIASDVDKRLQRRGDTAALDPSTEQLIERSR